MISFLGCRFMCEGGVEVAINFHFLCVPHFYFLFINLFWIAGSCAKEVWKFHEEEMGLVCLLS